MAEFVEVIVEESAECAGCAMRWKAESAPRVVTVVRYTPEHGPEVMCDVAGAAADGPCAAVSVTIEDSGGGTAALVWGGDRGLRLTPRDGGAVIAEPYLLIEPDALLSC